MDIVYKQMDIQQFAILILGVIILMLIYSILGALFQHKHFHYIHQTGLGILIGFIFGLCLHYITDISEFQFNQQIFFYALLPPIIFSGGYNLKKKKFFQNFSYITIYGVLGTLVSFGIILGFTYLINQLQLIRKFNIDQNVVLGFGLMIKFSATICATDSVAALTMIKPKDHPKLFSIIFGQGMMNDAVAIILFKVVGNIFNGADNSDSATYIIFNIIWRFILTLIVSFLIGLVVALVCSKLFKQARYLTKNPVTEVSVLYLFGIMSYVIAQIADMSGVITVLVCGICLAHFNFYNLSVTGQISTGYIVYILRVTFQTISFIAESFVFVYLGLTTMFYLLSEVSYTFVSLEIIICFFGRFGSIFGLSMLFKLFMKKWSVSTYEMAIISFAGTIRGSVAFALILTIQEDEHNQIQVKIIKSTVLIIVFITTILLGAAMPFLITCILSRDTATIAQNRQTFMLQEQLLQKGEKPRTFFKIFDEQYLKPFFIYKYVDRKEQIKQFKKLLKLNSPQFKGGQFIALMKVNARQSLAAEQVIGLEQGTIFTQN